MRNKLFYFCKKKRKKERNVELGQLSCSLGQARPKGREGRKEGLKKEVPKSISYTQNITEL